MNLVSNVRISASVKINWMAFTLTVLTTAFGRTEEKSYGFRQAVLKEAIHRHESGSYENFRKFHAENSHKQVKWRSCQKFYSV